MPPQDKVLRPDGVPTMSSHSQAHETCRRLCDGLVANLDACLRDTGGADRKESANWCSIGPAGGPRIAYVRHRKTSASLQLYVLAGLDSSKLPPGLALSPRTTIATGWEKRLPHYIEVNDESVLPGLAALVATLVDVPAPRLVQE